MHTEIAKDQECIINQLEILLTTSLDCQFIMPSSYHLIEMYTEQPRHPVCGSLLTVDELTGPGQFRDCCSAVLAASQDESRARLPRSHADQLHRADDTGDEVHLFSDVNTHIHN